MQLCMIGTYNISRDTHSCLGPYLQLSTGASGPNVYYVQRGLRHDAVACIKNTSSLQVLQVLEQLKHAKVVLELKGIYMK